MVPVIAKLEVKEGKMDEAIQMAKELTAEVAKEKGTLIYKFCRDPKKPDVLQVIEAYEDLAALNLHGNTPYFKDFFEKFAPIMKGAPEIVVLEELVSI